VTEQRVIETLDQVEDLADNLSRQSTELRELVASIKADLGAGLLGDEDEGEDVAAGS